MLSSCLGSHVVNPHTLTHYFQSVKLSYDFILFCFTSLLIPQPADGARSEQCTRTQLKTGVSPFLLYPGSPSSRIGRERRGRTKRALMRWDSDQAISRTWPWIFSQVLGQTWDSAQRPAWMTQAIRVACVAVASRATAREEGLCVLRDRKNELRPLIHRIAQIKSTGNRSASRK